MADTATAILHTPWDCRWSRFTRRTAGDGKRGGLWDCIRTAERVPISDTDCESCPFYEYRPPTEGLLDVVKASERAAKKERATRAVEIGVRMSLFVMAVIFAACGIVVLTTPLAVPFTISMLLGAAASLMLSIWGNFRSHADGSFRGFLPPRA
jgi:hypothetical protein